MSTKQWALEPINDKTHGRKNTQRLMYPQLKHLQVVSTM